MKFFQVILFFAAIYYIQGVCNYIIGVNSASDCKGKELSSVEIELGMKYCCFLKQTKDGITEKKCSAIDQVSYDHINEHIEYLEKYDGRKVESLDCISSYLEVGLFCLMFFLF